MTQFFKFPASGAAEAMNTIVFMFAAKSGAWIVRDQADSKGGVFATRKAARHFIKREFGDSAPIIYTNPETLVVSAAA